MAKPSVTLVGNSTPDVLSNIADSALESGLLQRFIVQWHDGDCRRQIADTDVPEVVLDDARAFVQRCSQRAASDSETIHADIRGFMQLQAFDLECDQYIDQPGGKVLGRAGLNARRVARLVALYNGLDHIDYDTACYAISIVHSAAFGLMGRIRGGQVASVDDSAARRTALLEFLHNWPKATSDRKRGPADGSCPKWYLRKRAERLAAFKGPDGKFSDRRFQEALAAFRELSEVVFVSNGSGSFRPANAWDLNGGGQ